MSKTVEDLWPTEFAELEVLPPVTILREQAQSLGRRTKNIVEGVVSTHSTAGGGFRHVFDLRVPVLNNYTYALFDLTHGLALYPVEVEWGFEQGGTFRLENEAQLVEHLRVMFRDPRTHRILQSLLVQASS